MKDRVERFMVLPFAIGCSSDSSIALGTSNNGGINSKPIKKPKSQPNPPPTTRRRETYIQGYSSSKLVKMRKYSLSFLALPKHNISSGIQRLIRSIKSFSQFFVYKEETEEIEIEKEIEIGYPTDVKHVTHIGLDGSTTTNPIKGWQNHQNHNPPPELLSNNFSSISFKQFELAMAAESHHHDQQVPQLVVDLQVKDNNLKA